MDDEKFRTLMKDENFVKELIAQNTLKQVRDLFQSRNFEISNSEIDLLGDTLALCADKLQKNGKLTKEDLQSVSGGGEGDKFWARVDGAVITAVMTVFGAVSLWNAGSLAGRSAAKFLGGGDGTEWVAEGAAQYAGLLVGGAAGFRVGRWIKKHLINVAEKI